MELISKSEYIDWRNRKVTREFVARIFEQREGLKEDLADGKASIEDLKILIGRAQGMKDVIDYILHDFEFIDDTPKEEQNA
jgi:hypothetical protein